MESTSLPTPTPLARKLVEIGLTAIAAVTLLLTLAEVVLLLLLPLDKMAAQEASLEAYAGPLLLGVLVLALGLTIFFAWRWQRLERRAGPTAGGARWHARLQGVIRYWLAFEIATYGFAKLLQTQFETANFQLDRPLGAVSGMALTWYYFGYARPFVIVLGLLQIGGAALLLFRRTTLVGTVLLLPILINIVFINLFYNIGAGAFFNSVVFTLGLSFLLGLEWPRLRAAFFVLAHALPAVHLGGSLPKALLRVGVLAGAGALVASLKSHLPAPTPLDGVWRVDAETMNGQPVVLDSCGGGTRGGWTRLYFAGWQGCVARFHPYRYEPKRELRGEYQYDAARHQLRAAMWPGGHPPTPKAIADSLVVTVQQTAPQHVRLTGRLGHSPILMSLTRLRD